MTNEVIHLIETVNSRNKASSCSPDVRRGWNSLAVEALGDDYAGFRFLREDELVGDAIGMAPGVVYVRVPDFVSKEAMARVHRCSGVLLGEEEISEASFRAARQAGDEHVAMRFTDDSRIEYIV